MDDKQLGLWSDYLREKEVGFSKICLKKLQEEKKFKDFIKHPQIHQAINIQSNKCVDSDKIKALKSALFEIRVANLIFNEELNFEYEFRINPNKRKTIDFKVTGEKLKGITCLLELSSIRESSDQKQKTYKIVNLYECSLDESSEVSIYIKTQKILADKAKKFIEPKENIYNVILLDMRSGILGRMDKFDYHCILFGNYGLPEGCTRQFNGNPFLGLFDESHPDSNVFQHVKNRIHCIGFVVEKEYKNDELKNKIIWFENPKLKSNIAVNLCNFWNG